MPPAPVALSPPPSRQLAAGQFFGGVVRHRRDGGLLLSEIVHSTRRLLPPHDHAAAGVCLVLRGGYRERIGSRWVMVPPGRAVYHPAAYRHRDEVGDGGVRFFFVELEGSFGVRAAEALPRRPLLDDRGMASVLALRLRHELDADDPAATLVREGLALELLGALARCASDGAAPAWVLRAEAALRERPEHRWSLADLAGAAAVSPVRLSRGFRRAFGESVGERLRRIRLESARDRLERPGSDLAEVALACGFADQSHLTRAFRAAFGVTPGAFRARTARG
jgi:AraC family transcriptional regulator